MARPRKPTALKVLHGTDQPCRMNPDEPKPKLCIPDQPSMLSGVALEEWNNVSPQLDTLGLMSGLDATGLAAYCMLYARWIEAEEDIRENGQTYTNTQGNIATNPAVSNANQALGLIHKFLSEFGMSPASRSRVVAKKKDKEANPWASKKKVAGRG